LRKNQELCDAIVQNAMSFYGIDEDELQRHISAAHASGRLADKISVSQALKHYVRDWAEAGESERKETFSCLVKTLQGLFPVRDDENLVKVLVPGSGLGRLGHDIARLGGKNPLNKHETSAVFETAVQDMSSVLIPFRI
jgi:hypothetical protein